MASAQRPAQCGICRAPVQEIVDVRQNIRRLTQCEFCFRPVCSTHVHFGLCQEHYDMLSETGRRSLQDIEAFFKDSAHKYALSYCALIPIFTVVIVIYAISNPSAFVDFSPTFFLVVFLPLGIILTITTAWYVSQIKATYRKKRDLILIALQENRITLRPLPPPFRIEGFKGIKFRRPPNLLYACGVCGKYEATPASPKQCPICFILLCKIHDCHHRT